MLSSYVSKFIKRGSIFYASDEPDKQMDDESYKLYSRALEETGQWLKKVLEAEVKEQGYTKAEAEIRLPLGNLHISVGSSISFIKRGRDCPVMLRDEENVPELYETPIGAIDHYTYKAIIEEKGNPVRQLIEHFSAGCLIIDGTLEQAVREKGNLLIDDDLLSEYKYQDPVGMHQMTPVYYDLARFFEGDYYY